MKNHQLSVRMVKAVLAVVVLSASPELLLTDAIITIATLITQLNHVVRQDITT